MTETVVHVTTIDQWKSVLDVWFAQGYMWFASGCEYSENKFEYSGSRQIALNLWGDDEIVCFINNDYSGDNLVEYAEFMAQQEKTMAKETYYVTQEQLDLIDNIKNCAYPSDEIVHHNEQIRKMVHYWNSNQDKAVLRYLGGDESIEFKVKEQLYRLWRIDDEGDTAYMRFNAAGSPTYTEYKNLAFTAPEEEIKKHKTVSWEIEKAD